MSVTIKDIARTANVSINTVSRALNDKDDVNKKTKEKILKIAKELNYTPNFLAKSLHLKQTKTLGVVVTDNANPFYASVIRGIEDAANEKGYSIILANTDESTEKEGKALKVLIEKRVDGILITPARTTQKNMDIYKKLNVPFIMVNRATEEKHIDYIKTDNVYGGYLALFRLLDIGKRKLVYLGGPDDISSVQERYQGCLNAISEFRLPKKTLKVYPTDLKMHGGYEIMKKILSSPHIPDGVFAYSDLIAIGVLKAIREAKLRIPKDIAVVGYDDIELSSYLEVPLTTVHQPAAEIGRRSTEEMVKKLEKSSEETITATDPIHILLKPELVVRKTA